MKSFLITLATIFLIMNIFVWFMIEIVGLKGWSLRGVAAAFSILLFFCGFRVLQTRRKS
jgi:membrane-bound ClpP family serine protease